MFIGCEGVIFTDALTADFAEIKLAVFNSAIEGETKVEVENEIHEIKAGSFMGNDCKIGANVIVEAGKIIGGKCTISPNKVVNRDVPDGSMVI